MFGGKHMVSVVDLLFCLLVVLALSQGHQRPPHIQTFGSFAVQDAWRAGSNDDVDLYVRDPAGNIAYFGNLSPGLLALGQDDLGTGITGTQTLPDGRTVVSSYNGERVLIHGILPGEYTVDVHMYAKRDPGPTTVTVQLWSLRGNDVMLHEQKVVLAKEGDEVTAFRFTVNAAGHVSNFNRLPGHLVRNVIAHGGTG